MLVEHTKYPYGHAAEFSYTCILLICHCTRRKINKISSVNQSHDSSLEAVASSHRGDDDGGFNYGVYDTGFLKYYDVEEASYDPEHQFACVEVKCPGLALDNETVPIPQNDPAVFVRINIKHPAEATCGFVR